MKRVFLSLCLTLTWNDCNSCLYFLVCRNQTQLGHWIWKNVWMLTRISIVEKITLLSKTLFISIMGWFFLFKNFSKTFIFYCYFRIVMPGRTFLVYATSEREKDAWLNILKWKLVCLFVFFFNLIWRIFEFF